MKLSYLTDTDWIIDHLNKRAEVAQKLRELRPDGIAVSIISVAELYEGVYYSTDPENSQRMLEILVRQFSILAVDEEICRIFGQERGRLRRSGKTVGDFDLMIACTCLRWNLTLLTNNKKHFETAKTLKIISLSQR